MSFLPNTLAQELRHAADLYERDDQPDCAGYLRRAVRALENAVPLEAEEISEPASANFQEEKSEGQTSEWPPDVDEANRYQHAQRPRGAENMLYEETGRRSGW